GWQNNLDPESQRGPAVLRGARRWILHPRSQAGREEDRICRHPVWLSGASVQSWAGPSGGPRHRVCIIDEIGKMELFSQPFIQAVRQTLSTPGTVVLGTIPVPKGKPLALVEEIRNRRDVKVFSVTKENRNSLLPDIVTCVQSSRT
uniref:Cancer-related nucleoside-triphosphatase n=1 Tax=Peromyscus maniculatus bairdii TaxID=230844 RepID=A0A8C8U0K7_PERMB